MNASRGLSLEFFPPRDENARGKLTKAAKELEVLNPAYVSVTFGAGGSTREGTADAVSLLQQAGYDAAPHLSCIGASRPVLDEILQYYRDQGVRRLVALRGDLPSGMGMNKGDLHHAVDLVRFIREHTGDWFHIEVAAYPEVHPQARGAQADLNHFAEKVQAGANSAITQYFFNADAYYDFVERAHGKGVNVPIVPGIMPITNHNQLVRFSDMCGAEVPRWIRQRLTDYGDDLASIRAFGAEVVTRLCQDLLDQGAPGLHFYTLNNASATLAVARQLT
ncbi:MAG: methylenetetrahydrofolate reductase [NAD(P)H] [Pusillimonas sp.]|jgi:methylenetetrahydrofolate reductase (NADPH)|nr:methylenetetrahydrofolate reductase [NAD(P)H] [Pusillimonas sp.]MBC42484.1 methylenetetrahydrofolate reductase [NAD(P)H] [Pusillimonas sp.]HCP76983.1 methylenetetrahydrofolate reductase [NAD(P)H] [Pusillimonas sp.]|tara:strand:+ start:296285 stop:297118 length:834 start_codon:yes stop_codon:yes gene_type:complete